MRLPVFSRLILAAVFLSVPAICFAAGFDLSKLDSPIDLTLDNSSMADAAYTIGRLAEINVAAPAEPKDGLTASWTQEPVRNVLNTLAGISGLRWHIENSVVVFRKPVTLAKLPAPPKQTTTPHDAMTAFLASLGDVQLFYISRGVPLPYAELTPAQQEIIRTMLVPNDATRTDPGTATISMPAPEQVVIAFRVMPSLVIPKTPGGEGMTLRLDSMPYFDLTGKEAR